MANTPSDSILDIVLENLFSDSRNFSGRIIDHIGSQGRQFTGCKGTAAVTVDPETKLIKIVTERITSSKRYSAKYYFTENKFENMRVVYLISTANRRSCNRTLDDLNTV